MAEEFLTIATVGASVTTFTDTGRSPNTPYTYRVVASNSVGDSPPSNQASATTTVGLPPAPTNLNVVVSTTAPTTSLVITWNAVSGSSSYKLQHATSATGVYSQIATGLTSPTFTHTGLQPSTTHFYRAVATNGAGDSPFSNVDSATTANVPPNGGGGTANCAQADVRINANEDVRSRINAAPANSLICIAAGTFNTSQPISPPSGCRIIGAGFSTASDGHGTNMRIIPTTIINWTGGFGHIFDCVSSNNVTFENLHIRGAHLFKQAGQGGVGGRGISEGNNITARHCLFTACESAAANGVKSNCVMEDCEMICGSTQGLGFAAGGVKCVNSMRLTRCYIHDCIGNGVWSDCGNPGPWIVEDCLIVGNRRKGVHWELSGGAGSNTAGFVRRNRVFGNNTEGQGDAGGIVANVSKNYLVENNTLSGNGQTDIRIKFEGTRPPGQSCTTGYPPSNIIVRNNNVSQPVVGCQHATCSGNV